MLEYLYKAVSHNWYNTGSPVYFHTYHVGTFQFDRKYLLAFFSLRSHTQEIFEIFIFVPVSWGLKVPIFSDLKDKLTVGLEPATRQKRMPDATHWATVAFST